MDKLKNISVILLILITIVFGYLLFKKKDPKVIEVPIKIEVPVPGKDGKSDTIYLPSPIKENPINLELLKKYNEAKDSIAKLELYKEAVREREYETIFKDSTQSISVSSKVQGKLLNQSITYEIYPTTIPVDTTIEIPIVNKNKFFVGGEVIVPLNSTNLTPAFKANILFKNKKDNIFSIGYDTKNNIYLGYNIKL